jgi:hypothetical protein
MPNDCRHDNIWPPTKLAADGISLKQEREAISVAALDPLQGLTLIVTALSIFDILSTIVKASTPTNPGAGL